MTYSFIYHPPPRPPKEAPHAAQPFLAVCSARRLEDVKIKIEECGADQVNSERYKTRKQHTEHCKRLIESRRLDVPYLEYIARFHGKLQGRPIAEITWNTTGGFKAVFDGGESVTFSYNTCLDGIQRGTRERLSQGGCHKGIHKRSG